MEFWTRQMDENPVLRPQTKSQLANLNFRKGELEHISRIQMAYNASLNHIHLQDQKISIDDYDDSELAKKFFEGAQLYKDLPFAHSNTCPYVKFRKNCE